MLEHNSNHKAITLGYLFVFPYVFTQLLQKIHKEKRIISRGLQISYVNTGGVCVRLFASVYACFEEICVMYISLNNSDGGWYA